MNEGLYFIEFGNKNFGGSWTHDYYNYFILKIYFCKKGENYYKNNLKCISTNEINFYFINDKIIFTLFMFQLNLILII